MGRTPDEHPTMVARRKRTHHMKTALTTHPTANGMRYTACSMRHTGSVTHLARAPHMRAVRAALTGNLPCLARWRADQTAAVIFSRDCKNNCAPASVVAERGRTSCTKKCREQFQKNKNKEYTRATSFGLIPDKAQNSICIHIQNSTNGHTHNSILAQQLVLTTARACNSFHTAHCNTP
eukprot:m.279745 g.279745  ORF g.279745 m.279745 type:complete len:179 (-) comp19813_c0_seq1:1798-2334(-)